MNKIGLETLIRREIWRYMRLWRQTLIPPIITALLYLTVFGKVVGSRVGIVQGVDYIQFVLPGLAMLTMILASFQNCVSSFFIEKFHRSIDELMVSPLTSFEIVIGFIIGGVTRGLLCGILVIFLGCMVLNITVIHWVYMILVMIIVTLCFSSLGMLNAMYARNFDEITIVPDFILTPLIFFGGVFYDGSHLQGILLWLHQFNPISYFVDLFRYSLLGIH
jgi:ABC-2 type transport system permease protein